MTGDQLASIMAEVARHFWGEPNPARSTGTELRWGSNGARSVDLAKGAWFDFEANEGGGVLDLLKREHVAEPWQWLRKNGFTEHRDNGAGARPKIVGAYDYIDEAGALLSQVVRFDPKTFRQRRPARPDDPPDKVRDGWVWSLEGVRRVLFRLPELLEALALERRIFITEGEKDTLTLAGHGIDATCNAGGAGKWRDEFAEQLVGADVVILPDNDAAGRLHADIVARSLIGKAARVRVVELPDLPDKGDVSDWFGAGGTVERFNELIEAAADWTAGATQAPDEKTNDKPQQNGHILPGTEFAELSTASRKVWLVHHLLATGEVSVWYGEPGSGKSVGLEDLGLHLAAGRIWHGRQVMQCAVLYVALERAAVVARRAIAWGIEHDLLKSQLPFKVIRGPLDFREAQIAADIVITVEDLAQRHRCTAGLVMVDTVSRALCGGDENSPKDMGALVANISRIQAAIGVHVALTHHQPAEKERMRGHGALLGAADTTIHVVNKDGMRLAEVVKSSDHEEGQRIAFTLKSVTIDQDDGYGDPVTAPVMVEGEVIGTSRKPSAALKGANKIALRALDEAIYQLGKVPPASNYIPANVKTTTIAHWRDYAYRMGISELENPDARKRAFARASQKLASDKFIGIWEPHVWIAGDGEEWRGPDRTRVKGTKGTNGTFSTSSRGDKGDTTPKGCPSCPPAPVLETCPGPGEAERQADLSATSTSAREKLRPIGPAPAGTVCVHCHRADGEVMKVRSAEPGSKTEPLHLDCASRWFSGDLA